jgi:tRNA(Ile2) C34 agmatinyltransferase TiaS
LKAYIGFDDTDTLDSDFGTGKVVRWFEELLPEGCECRGVVRQQLLVCDEIPYTSHNSAACMVVEVAAVRQPNEVLKELADLASDHIVRRAAEGSDPGLCVVGDFDSSLDDLVEFGHNCTHRVLTQKEALRVASGSFLAGLGGSNDGLIGAAAAVGLTASGWSGRYIEFGNLRRYPETVSVSELDSQRIAVISTDRDARVPSPNDLVLTNGWVRPVRLGHKPVLLVAPEEDGLWVTIHTKRHKKAAKSLKV